MIKNFFLSLLVILLLSSCIKKVGNAIGNAVGYVFSSEEGTELFVNIDTNEKINLNPYTKASQPLRLCMFIVKSSTWVPDGLYEGVPCKNEANNNTSIIDSKQLMLSPNNSYNIKLPLVYNRKDTSDIWLVIAGNFQDFQSSTQIIHEKIKRTTKVRVQVMVDKNKIFIQNNKKKKKIERQN